MGTPKRKWAVVPETLVCEKCGQAKPIEKFNWTRTHKRTTCSSCKLKGYRDKLRQRVLKAYGSKCACCGDANPEFLTVDHVGNWGHRDRTGPSVTRKTGVWLYREIERLGFPQDVYRLLCYNCNCSIGLYGYCPHRPLIRIDTARVIARASHEVAR